MESNDPPGSALASPDPSAAAVPSADYRARRWRLVRDLVVFQGKLLVDGIKDLVFAPIALIAALVGLLANRDDPGRTFYMLLRWGHGFDRWVNLFGGWEPRALPPSSTEPTRSAPSPDAAPAASPTVDAYVHRLEKVLVEQYRRGGLTAKAKDALDDALDSLHERSSRSGPSD